MSMDGGWFVVRGGQTVGPMSREELLMVLPSAGGPSALVWGPGIAEWTEARHVAALAVGTADGLYVRNNNSFIQLTSGAAVSAITFGDNEKVYFASGREVKACTVAGQSPTCLSEVVLGEEDILSTVTALGMGSDGVLSVGTQENGVIRLSDGSSDPVAFGLADGLIGMTVQSMLAAGNSLWIGTLYGGTLFESASVVVNFEQAQTGFGDAIEPEVHLGPQLHKKQ